MLLAQLTAFAESGCQVTAMSAPGPWRGDIETAGIRFIEWTHASRRLSPLGDVRAFFELLRTLRRERFDVVHTHNPKPGLLGRLAAWLARTPVVVNTVHGFYTTEDRRSLGARLYMLAERVAARCSHFELYQSGEDLRRARSMRIVADARSAHLGNGTDLLRFDRQAVDESVVARLRAEWNIPDDAIVVGMVGRLVREKGWQDFFEAARIVRASRPDVVFVGIGPADEAKRDALPDHVLEAAARDVRLCGETLVMPEALSLLDVFVLSSYREGVPRSAVEAAAMGLPLVLTDIRGCREVVEDGRNGLLVAVRSPEQLAEAIGRLVDDPELRTAFGTESRTLATTRFDERRVAALTLRVYDALLDRRGRNRP